MRTGLSKMEMMRTGMSGSSSFENISMTIIGWAEMVGLWMTTRWRMSGANDFLGLLLFVGNEKFQMV
jgi:hypothetical protein